MIEIWKDIPNYETLYQISNLGNVKSLSYGAKNIKRSNRQKLLKLSLNNCGYVKVQLYKNGKATEHYVHRLVALAFIPNPNKLPQVNHIDGNKTNNCSENLEWVTASDNQKHAITHGLRCSSPMIGRFGRLHPTSKKILQYDKYNNLIAKWDTLSEASTQLNLSISALSATLHNKQKTCGGFIWKFDV